VHQYSEALLVKKPRLYMTVEELVEVHKVVVQNKNAVAPETSDLLRIVVEEIGEVPTAAKLLGCKYLPINNFDLISFQQTILWPS